jgi:hypothetical protein
MEIVPVSPRVFRNIDHRRRQPPSRRTVASEAIHAHNTCSNDDG